MLGALGITLFLAFQSLREGGIIGCGPNSGCHKVLNSRWAYIVGIPVSLFAATLYTSMLAAIHSATHGHPPARKILSAGALMILGAALWFTGVQAVVLRAYCWFCMTAHVIGSVGALVVLTKLAHPSLKSSLTAVGLLAAFIATQVAVTPKSYVETALPTNTTPMVTAPPLTNAAVQVTTNDLPKTAEDPTISLFNGRFSFKASEFPVNGRADSPQRVVKLFDFTCHYCRELHFHLQKAKSTFTNLTVILLPVPLDASCNHLMRSTQAAHVNACAIAKLGLAVWNTDPAKFHTWEERLWALKGPASVEQVRAWCVELIGAEKLEAALADARITRQLALAIDVYEANSRQAGRGSLPQMIFPAHSIVGAIRSPQELLTILSNNFSGTVVAPAPPAGN